MIIYFLMLAAIALRFVPHMPNFAPITALAIFGGANLGWKKAAGLTLAVRFISDIFLGFFSWPLMVAVYAAHLAGVLFGVWIKQPVGVIPSASEGSLKQTPLVKGFFSRMRSFGLTHIKWVKITGSSLAASTLFFLVTNFAFLYSGYAHNISGIILAYANGLPFLRGTLMGDLGYSVALFGAYDLAVALKSSRSKLPPVVA
ncbi:MAG: hypothetical protein P4L74_00080 [Candidatus Doudnabacteria bacterium]|nr:hypothetical protein [Candidatus Doudnabacteria bacterium]